MDIYSADPAAIFDSANRTSVFMFWSVVFSSIYSNLNRTPCWIAVSMMLCSVEVKMIPKLLTAASIMCLSLLSRSWHILAIT